MIKKILSLLVIVMFASSLAFADTPQEPDKKEKKGDQFGKNNLKKIKNCKIFRDEKGKYKKYKRCKKNKKIMKRQARNNQNNQEYSNNGGSNSRSWAPFVYNPLKIEKTVSNSSGIFYYNVFGEELHFYQNPFGVWVWSVKR